MRIGIIDFVGNPGGGIRFASELIKGFIQQYPNSTFEVRSYGAALQRYRAQLGDVQEHISFHESRPERHRLAQFTRIIGSLPVIGKLMPWLSWSYEVPAAILKDCDVVWFPWVHSHRLPLDIRVPIVGSLHDIILLQFPGLLRGYLPASLVRDERETIRRWIESPAQLVVSSAATVNALGDLFGMSNMRVDVIHILGDHAKTITPSQSTLPWQWAHEPFLLCPANIMPHKNHELLLEGVAQWGGRRPLVLTGERTELGWPNQRGIRLRRLAESLGLRIGIDLIPLGYISGRDYQQLLDRAWAVVMPTLAEGGGSFPVLEAMSRGVPVVCSDIPVLREQLAFTGGDVLWFNPSDASQLAARLSELNATYESVKAKAAIQSRELKHRTWRDIARDYWSVLASAAGANGQRIG